MHLDNIPNTFIEFGVENYREANTRLLAIMRNWKGLIIDGCGRSVKDIYRQQVYWRHRIIAVHEFISTDNIQDIIVKNGFSGDLGVLSIDIDGNDFWLWKSIDCIRPVIVVCEYNAVFGDLHSITVPYAPDFRRSIAHWSNLYFGSSIRALLDLASSKGYTFIGSNKNGINAFFVRNDAASALIGKLKYYNAYNSLFRESRDQFGRLTFKNGSTRLNVIRDLPIYDLTTGKVVPISSLGELSSSEWLAGKPRSTIS
jgi:hypothetical protein